MDLRELFSGAGIRYLPCIEQVHRLHERLDIWTNLVAGPQIEDTKPLLLKPRDVLCGGQRRHRRTRIGEIAAAIGVAKVDFEGPALEEWRNRAIDV